VAAARDLSKLHVRIVGNLAGFAFTGVVLVVTLCRERIGCAQTSLDTVIAMFLVAYLYWIGVARYIDLKPIRKDPDAQISTISASANRRKLTPQYSNASPGWAAS